MQSFSCFETQSQPSFCLWHVLQHLGQSLKCQPLPTSAFHRHVKVLLSHQSFIFALIAQRCPERSISCPGGFLHYSARCTLFWTPRCGGFQMPGQPCWYEQHMHGQHMQHMQPVYATCQREPRLRKHAALTNSAFAFKALETSIDRCCLVPECVAKGSRFTLGVWGRRGVRSTLLLCPEPSATVCTVCNRWQPSATIRDDCAMAVPMESAAKVVTSGCSNFAQLRFVRQAWHFVSSQHVS